MMFLFFHGWVLLLFYSVGGTAAYTYIPVYTGKIAAGAIWASKSGKKNSPAVAELLPDVTPT